MKNLIDVLLLPYLWLFNVPPASGRINVPHRLRKVIHLEFDIEKNETYACFKTFMLNLFLNIFFMSMYFISFLGHIDVDLFFFEIIYSENSPLDVFAYEYPKHVFPILATATVAYAIMLYSLRTDFFSKERVLKEAHKARYGSHIYEVKPIHLICALLITFYAGAHMYSLIDLLRLFDLYNYFYNFRVSSTGNFLIYAAFYFFIYQVIFYHALTQFTVYLIRSILRNYVYRGKPEER